MNDEYANELLGAMRSQRDRALDGEADANAKLTMVRKQLSAILNRIKDKGLMEHFTDEPKKAAVVAQPEKQEPGELGGDAAPSQPLN